MLPADCSLCLSHDLASFYPPRLLPPHPSRPCVHPPCRVRGSPLWTRLLAGNGGLISQSVGPQGDRRWHRLAGACCTWAREAVEQRGAQAMTHPLAPASPPASAVSPAELGASTPRMCRPLSSETPCGPGPHHQRSLRSSQTFPGLLLPRHHP